MSCNVTEISTDCCTVKGKINICAEAGFIISKGDKLVEILSHRLHIIIHYVLNYCGEKLTTSKLPTFMYAILLNTDNICKFPNTAFDF